jgi:flavorubredoxin
MITNSQSGTNVHEVADGIYRINTPVMSPGGVAQFSFNQYLVIDDAPLLFHAGLRQMFPLLREAIAALMPLEKLAYVGVSHFESDECGALNPLLAVAPRAVPVCGHIAAMVSINDFADRAPRPLADGEQLSLGRHQLRWFDTPQMPHGWDCGLVMDLTTRTFFCGDLFTQGGGGELAVTESDILGASEAFRASMDYYAHAPRSGSILERLARERPATLACMHGSAWRGDGAGLLRQLAEALG